MAPQNTVSDREWARRRVGYRDFHGPPCTRRHAYMVRILQKRLLCGGVECVCTYHRRTRGPRRHAVPRHNAVARLQLALRVRERGVAELPWFRAALLRGALRLARLVGGSEQLGVQAELAARGGEVGEVQRAPEVAHSDDLPPHHAVRGGRRGGGHRPRVFWAGWAFDERR